MKQSSSLGLQKGQLLEWASTHMVEVYGVTQFVELKKAQAFQKKDKHGNCINMVGCHILVVDTKKQGRTTFSSDYFVE